jgi:hypothetical protein
MKKIDSVEERRERIDYPLGLTHFAAIALKCVVEHRYVLLELYFESLE